MGQSSMGGTGKGAPSAAESDDDDDQHDGEDGVDLARKPWTREVPALAPAWPPAQCAWRSPGGRPEEPSAEGGGRRGRRRVCASAALCQCHRRAMPWRAGPCQSSQGPARACPGALTPVLARANRRTS